MALNRVAGSGSNNNTYGTITFQDDLNPGDLIVVNILQKGGSLGTFDDPLNTYNLYSSNTSGAAPQSYNFYSIVSSRTTSGTVVTYSPSGTTTNISISYSVFRPDSGEKFGPPIVTNSTTGNTPATTISTTIPSALAPAVMIASTNLTNMAGFNYPADYAGNANWTPIYINSILGMATTFKITSANATQVYNPTFISTTAFQTILNFPILLNISPLTAVSGGNLPGIRPFSGVIGGAQSGGSINLNPVSQGLTSRAVAQSGINAVVSLNIQPQPTINVVSNANHRTGIGTITRVNLHAYPEDNIAIMGGYVPTIDSSFKLFGNYSFRSQSGNSLGTIQGNLTPTYGTAIAPNKTYTASIYVYSPIANTFFIQAAWTNGVGFLGGQSKSADIPIPANKWTRISHTFTVPTSPTGIVGANVLWESTGVTPYSVGNRPWFDGMMVEESSTLNPYFGRSSIEYDTDYPIVPTITSLGSTSSRASYYDPGLVNYNLSLSAGATVNAAIRPSAIAPAISPIRANAVSGGSISTLIPSQLLLNSDFADGTNKWYSNSGTLSISNDTYSGTQSLKVTGSNDYTGEPLGPLGAYQTFRTYGTSKKYTLTAYVKNTGTAPTNMYAGFTFDNGASFNSSTRTVSPNDGWVKIEVSGVYSKTTWNFATAYILTSTPFDTTLGDIAVIDGVTLTASDTINSIVIPANRAGVNSNASIATQMFTNTDGLSITSTAIAKPTLLEKFNFQTNIVQSTNDVSNMLEKFNFQSRLIQSIGSATNANISLNSISIVIPATRAIARVGGDVITQMFTQDLGLIIRSTAFGRPNLTEKFNFQTNIIQSTNDISNGMERISTRYIIPTQILSTSDADILTRSVMRISPISALTKSNGYIDPLITSFNNINLTLSLSANLNLDENITLVMAVPSGPFDGTWGGVKSNAIEKISYRSNIISIITTTSNANIKIASPQPFRLVIGATSDADMQSSVNFAPRSIAGMSSNATSRLTFAETFSTSGSLISDSNGYEKFNFQSRPIIQITTTSNAAEKIVYNTRIINSVNAISGASFPIKTDNELATLPALIAIARGNANSVISISLPISSQLIARPNLSEKFNFQSRIIQSTNSAANATVSERSIMGIPSTRAIANSSGYSDPLINQGYTTQLAISNLIAKSGAYERFNFERVLAQSINSKSNVSEKFNFQSRIINTTNDITGGSEKFSFVLSAGAPKAFTSSSGYFDPLLTPINTITLPPLIANIKSGAIEKITLAGSFVPEIPFVSLIDNLIQDGSFDLGSSYWRGINNTVAVVSVDGNNLQINSYLQDLEQQPVGPLGAYQTFNAVVGYKYQLTANVQNFAGSSPREMYVQFTWANGQISKGNITQVSTTNGWVTLTVSGIAERTGLATAYIVTSTPFDNINYTDLALVDNVSVYAIALPAAPYLNLVARGNANSIIQHVSRLSEKLYSDTNALINLAQRMPIAIQAITKSNGYSDPLVAPIFSLSTSAKASSSQNLNIVLSTTFSPILDLIAKTNLFEKFNFQSRIVQSINSTTNANSSVVYRSIISAQAQIKSNGYTDPTLTFIASFAPLNFTGLSKVNAVEKISFVSSPIVDAIAKPNLIEKFNFQSRIIQSINSTSNANLFVISGQPLRLSINAQSSGYIDPTITSINNINISAQAGARSGGSEKLTLIGSFVSSVPTISLTDNFIQDGEFEFGSTYWKGINNTVSVVPSDQGNSLKINSSFQDFEQQPIGPLGVYQTFNAVVGYKYQLSAIVQNTTGSSPRDMYVQITWANGQVSKSALTQVNNIDGWVTLSVSGIAQRSGTATAYVVTSTPFDNLNATDTSLVDNVSVYAIDVPATPYLGLNARVNANSTIRLISTLSERLYSDANANSNIGLSARISPIFAQANTTGYFDPTVSSFGTFNIGPINLFGKTNLKEYFSFVSQPTPTINVISNSIEKFRFINAVKGFANISTNTNSNIGLTYRIQPNTAFALSSGYVDPLVNSINNINISVQANPKSNGYEKISLVQTFSTATQIVPNNDNQLQDTSFELGSSYWYGINNYISVVSDSPYNGLYSLKTNTFNSYEEYLDGPLGIGQNFVAVGGRTYNFYAYVQNTAGATPRNMYVSIQWNGSIVSSGIAIPVAAGTGWTKIELTAQAPTSGVARAYIITSSPFGSIGGDTSLVDNVSLTITDSFGPVPYIGIAAKSYALIKTSMLLTASSALVAKANLLINPVARYAVQPNIAIANSILDIQISRNIPISLSLNATSFGSYPRASVLQISRIQSTSNAVERLSTNYKLISGTNTISGGFAPDILPNRMVDISPLTINVKSGGQESLTLIQTIITNQPPSIPGNIVLDSEFALGSLYWSGIANNVEVTQDYSYSGSQSLLIKAVDISDPDYMIPLGATQKFNSLAGREYVFSAYVRNLVGDTRSMSLRLVWNNSSRSESSLKLVSIADGWVRLELRASAPVTGAASLYIVTSSAFTPFATDVAVIDAVSLTVADSPALTVNMIAKSGGQEKFALRSAISPIIISDSNAIEAIRTIYRLPLFINVKSNADLISTSPISLGALTASAKVYATEGFGLISTIKPPNNIDDITLSLIANTNLTIRLRLINSVDGLSLIAKPNLAEKFNFQSRLISQITTTSLGFADLAVTTLGNIVKLSAAMRSGGDVITTVPVDLQYMNAIADSNARDKFSFQSIITQSSDSTSNAFEFIRHVSRIPATIITTTSTGYIDLSVIQPSTIKLISAGGNSGGDIQVSVERAPIEPLCAGMKSNAFSKVGIRFPLKPGERINLLRNPSFEEGTKYWNSISNYNGVSKDIFYEGTQSIIITDNDWGNSGIWQEFNAYAGANYTFSAYVKNVTGLSPRSMHLQIQWADGSISESPLQLVGNEDGWVRLTLITNAGKNKTGVSTASIIVSSLPDALVESNAVSAVDAVVLVEESFVSDFFNTQEPTGTRLEATSNGRINPSFNSRLIASANVKSNGGFYQAPTPLLLNTDFELGTAYWTGVNNNVDATASYVRTGTQAVIVTSLNTFDEFPVGPFGISQNFVSYANRKYTFSGYVRNIAGIDSRSMYAQIRWANATSSIGQIKVVAVSDDWTLVEVSAVSPVTGSATAQILTSSPFGGINGGDVAVIDSILITEEYIPMQFIRLTGLVAGESSNGYVDPTVSTIGTFAPYSNAIAKVNGNANLRFISDISGTTSVESTNAIIRISSIMSIGPVRAQAQSVAQGNFEPFNPGLIIPQFSRAFARVGGDVLISVTMDMSTNLIAVPNGIEKIAAIYSLAENITVKSNAGGTAFRSSDPGIITQLVPYEINLNALIQSNGRINDEFGGNVAFFIGWGQPL